MDSVSLFPAANAARGRAEGLLNPWPFRRELLDALRALRPRWVGGWGLGGLASGHSAWGAATQPGQACRMGEKRRVLTHSVQCFCCATCLLLCPGLVRWLPWAAPHLTSRRAWCCAVRRAGHAELPAAPSPTPRQVPALPRRLLRGGRLAAGRLPLEGDAGPGRGAPRAPQLDVRWWGAQPGYRVELLP